MSSLLLKISNTFHKLSRETSDGAGILFTCTEDNSALFLLRADGTWGIPGGKIEAGEKPFDAAKRETLEEIRSIPGGTKYMDYMINQSGIDQKYHIFIFNIALDDKKEWTKTITLNREHSEYRWFKQNNIPENLFSGIRILDH